MSLQETADELIILHSLGNKVTAARKLAEHHQRADLYELVVAGIPEAEKPTFKRLYTEALSRA